MAENDRLVFDNNFHSGNNHNLEETEELEDQKRREEEVF